LVQTGNKKKERLNKRSYRGGDETTQRRNFLLSEALFGKKPRFRSN